MDTLTQLYDLIQKRKLQPADNSYTQYLFKEGIDKIGKKIAEESMELVLAAKNKQEQEIINETADLLYHLLVLLAQQNIDLNAIDRELAKRQEKMGNLKTRKPASNL